MKKKTIANILMVVIIVAIAGAGILTAGYIQGWFDSGDGGAALTRIRGVLTLERDGVAFRAEEGTVLRPGDRLTCGVGATAVIGWEDCALTLGEKASLEIGDPAAGSFCAQVTAGEVFVEAGQAGLTLSFDGEQAAFSDAVALLSVRSGAQSVSVFSGTVEEAQAGQLLEWVAGTRTIRALPLESLNDFAIARLRGVDAGKILCFAVSDLDRLAQQRREEQQAPEQTTLPTKPEQTTTPVATEPEQTEDPGTSAETAPRPTEPETTTATQETQPVSPTETVPPTTEAPATEPPVTEAPTTEPPVEPTYTCTLSIRCDTILDNMDKLDPAKAGYVPDDGWILYATVAFTQGETVFDVLARACDTYGIQLEYSWTPIYDSYYVEGIHHLYEFDCGSESGWMYKVNGWFPNYGCSSYTLSDGDSVVWCYTCVGLGADVGGGW